jgi:Tfp pilus assembly pilus retraction ATPase PilT
MKQAKDIEADRAPAILEQLVRKAEVARAMQTEVNEARGLNFAKAARHLLRQDPQVLVIGERRARTWRSGDAN